MEKSGKDIGFLHPVSRRRRTDRFRGAAPDAIGQKDHSLRSQPPPACRDDARVPKAARMRKMACCAWLNARPSG